MFVKKKVKIKERKKKRSLVIETGDGGKYRVERGVGAVDVWYEFGVWLVKTDDVLTSRILREKSKT